MLILIGLLAGGLPACNTHELETIQPQPNATVSTPLSVADAERWYKAQAGSVPTGTNAQQTATATGRGPLPIDWAHAADTVASARFVVMAPLKKTSPAFVKSGYQSFRYLLLTRPNPAMVSAAVVEVLV